MASQQLQVAASCSGSTFMMGMGGGSGMGVWHVSWWEKKQEARHDMAPHGHWDQSPVSPTLLLYGSS